MNCTSVIDEYSKTPFVGIGFRYKCSNVMFENKHYRLEIHGRSFTRTAPNVTEFGERRPVYQ